MKLANVIRGIVADQLAQVGQPRFGTVVSVNPNSGTVRVILDADGTLSGELPIAQTAAGNGWSAVTLPTPGTQVFMVPDGNSAEDLVVVGATHSTGNPIGKVKPYGTGDAATASPPQPLVPGETTLMHPGGATLRLTTDPNNNNAPVIEINGTLKVNGDIVLTGDVYDVNKHWGSLDQLRQVYNLHDHSGVQPGSGNTAQTTIPVNHR